MGRHRVRFSQMGRADRFRLEGWDYYQQYPKCGRASCGCSMGRSDLHGPYWYSRSSTGKVVYVGKALPTRVALARVALEGRLVALGEERMSLLQRVDALGKLRSGSSLSGLERGLLHWMGYGDCLVGEVDAEQIAFAAVMFEESGGEL